MYFYEHVNGKIISKTDMVVDSIGPHDYFDSDFVVRWWHEPGNHTVPKKELSQRNKEFWE